MPLDIWGSEIILINGFPVPFLALMCWLFPEPHMLRNFEYCPVWSGSLFFEVQYFEQWVLPAVWNMDIRLRNYLCHHSIDKAAAGDIGVTWNKKNQMQGVERVPKRITDHRHGHFFQVLGISKPPYVPSPDWQSDTSTLRTCVGYATLLRLSLEVL